MKPNTMDCDTPEALRFLASACERPIEDEWMRKAADEIERLRNERNHWMAAARAFDEHLATMRVMFMEHPTIRFR